MSFEEKIVKEVAKQYNIDESEARDLLSPLLSKKDRLEEFKKFVERLETAIGLVSQLPSDTRQLVGPSIIDMALRGDEEEILDKKDLEKIALKTAYLKEVFNTIRGTSGEGEGRKVAEVLKDVLEGYRREIEGLKSELSALRDRLTSREREEFIKDLVSDISSTIEGKVSPLLQKLEGLEGRVKSLEEKGTGRIPKGVGEGVREIVEGVKALKESIKELKESVPEMVETTKPGTVDIEEIKERVRKELETEAKLEMKRIETVGSLLKDLIREFGRPLVERFAEEYRKSVREAVREKIKSRVSAEGVESGEKGELEESGGEGS